MANPQPFPGNYAGYQLYFNVSRSNGPGANQSTFTWSAYIYATAVNYKPWSNNASTVVAYIGGNQVLNTTFTYDYRSAVANTVVTNFGSGSVVFDHNTAGVLGDQYVYATVTLNGNPGTATADSSVAGADYVRLPTTPARPTLARSNNGATLTITGGAATFYGSGGYYQYQTSTNGTTWSSEATLGSGRVSSVTVTNTNTMYARTRAIDSEGTGAWSATSLASTGVPGTPSTPTATRTADGTSITITSATVSGATGYTYQQSLNGSTWDPFVNIASGTSATITGRVYDQVYYYQTRARNAVGFGAWSATRSVAGVNPAFTSSTIVSPASVGIAYKTTTNTDVKITADRVRTFSVKAGGSLPPGLSLNATTGVISGTPTTPGTYSFVFVATNNAGSVESPSRTIVVNSSARVWVTRVAPETSGFANGLANVWVTRVAPLTSGFVSGTIRVWDGTTWKNTS